MLINVQFIVCLLRRIFWSPVNKHLKDKIITLLVRGVISSRQVCNQVKRIQIFNKYYIYWLQNSSTLGKWYSKSTLRGPINKFVYWVMKSNEIIIGSVVKLLYSGIGNKGLINFKPMFKYSKTLAIFGITFVILSISQKRF